MKKILYIVLSFYFHTCYAVTIDKIIVFGDSLSDTGNVYSLTSSAHYVMPRVPIIPKQPYYAGRFSNGPVWADLLSEQMNVPLVDYAYAGSWAEPLEDSKWNMPFGLGMQVDFYLIKGVLDFHKENHLYVIWSGANDYLQGREDAEYATTNTISSIQKQIESLIYHGAKHFLIMNEPNIGTLPEVLSKGKDFSMAVSHLAILHNQKLAEMIKEEKNRYPDIQIIPIDIETCFNEILSDPPRFHLKNIVQPCYEGNYYLPHQLLDFTEIQAAKRMNIDIEQSPSLKVAYLTAKLKERGDVACIEPDAYLFWDEVHPTRAIHALLSHFILTALRENNIQ
jgi:phospholipase/lecithinase/hemolysin